jgi:hypothetical protein
MKLGIAQWVYRNLADEWGGSESPPGVNAKLDFGDLDNGRPMHIARTYCNDGHDLWLGTPNQWYVFYEAKYARRLAWFILWEWWAKGTWFGLKSKLWFWALHIKVEEHKRYKPV